MYGNDIGERWYYRLWENEELCIKWFCENGESGQKYQCRALQQKIQENKIQTDLIKHHSQNCKLSDYLFGDYLKKLRVEKIFLGKTYTRTHTHI